MYVYIKLCRPHFLLLEIKLFPLRYCLWPKCRHPKRPKRVVDLDIIPIGIQVPAMDGIKVYIYVI